MEQHLEDATEFTLELTKEQAEQLASELGVVPLPVESKVSEAPLSPEEKIAYRFSAPGWIVREIQQRFKEAPGN